MLLEHLHSSRQQLLRLLALGRWSIKSKALQECVDSGKVLDVAAQHARKLSGAADELYAAHMRLLGQPTQIFDVQTAAEVLTTGESAGAAQGCCRLNQIHVLKLFVAAAPTVCAMLEVISHNPINN